MKTIILVRHAKSSWEFDVSDRDRPLKKRGIIDANLVSKKFREHHFLPEIVFSSPANRALSTCKIFLQNLDISDKILKISDEIYDFGGQSVINFIKKLDNNIASVMLFGHNHAFTSLANVFGTTYIDNLPTSGLVKLTFDIKKWDAIELGKTELIIFPRHLK